MMWLERLAHLMIECSLVYLVIAQLADPGLCWRCLAHRASCRGREGCSRSQETEAV